MKNKIIMIAIQVLVLILAIGATWWFTKGDEPQTAADGTESPAAEVKSGPPEYVSLAPAFVVNLQGGRPMRFLMVEVELMTRKDGADDTIKEYLPSLRHELNMLFSAQTQESIGTLELREQLQQTALEKVNELLKAQAGRGDVEAVYFTKFVVQ